MRRIALIGAGFIAGAHLEALAGVRNARTVAVVDPDEGRACALARRAGDGVQYYSSIEALLTADKPDAAHVLTPPPLHRACAEPLLEAGVDVLLEKPMAETEKDCAALMAAAQASGAALMVNHNFTHHPAWLRLKTRIESGRYGPVRAVQMRYAAPLRQMAARQFGHWMFDSPRNLLLEQAVHPLSLFDDLLGPVTALSAAPAAPERPAEGVAIANRWALSLQCGHGEGQLQMILGSNFPAWTVSVLCDDGVVEADLFEDRVTARTPHAEIAAIDHARRGFQVAGRAAVDGAGGLTRYAREILRLGPKSDGFNRSMAGAVAAFHTALDQKAKARPDGAVGLRLVRLCEQAAQSADAPPIPAIARPGANAAYDVAVLGGTGFIGQHLVKALREEGARVAVMARSTRNLPGLYHDPGIGVYGGSISDAQAVADVVSRAPKVVNLAHGGGGADRDAVTRAMVGGAETVAEACLKAGAERLLFISSSAALWLGDPAERLDATTPADREPRTRGDYAYAKVMAERAMLAMHEEHGLPVSILRPAVVVGEGGAPFHSALGAYNTETHCVGWNHGRNPLPFVLAEDVAVAIIRALDANIDAISGRSFNLVGDVRWSARRYTEELAKATGRPLEFHANSVVAVAGMEWLKWAAKKISGRKGVAAPQGRDLRSRAMVSEIDISIEKELLRWEPCADEDRFHERAIAVHARR